MAANLDTLISPVSVVSQIGPQSSGGDTEGLSAQQVTKAATVVPQSASSIAPSDFRARLTVLNPNDVFGSSSIGGLDGANPTSTNGLLDILQKTQNGIIFPYSPTISFTQAVNYADISMVHSNTDYAAYTRTPSVSLSVTGKFTVQNQLEGQYALAVIHFLRTVSKSYFGEKENQRAGLPPPVLQFSAYGQYMYNKLRVVLKSHSWNYDEAMDTIMVNVPAIGNAGPSQVRLPAMFSVQTELLVVQTPQRMRKNFNFADFASGKLMSDGGWI